MNMRILRYSLLFITLSASFSSCKKDDDSPKLQLQINPLWDNQPFVRGQVYTLANNHRVKLTKIHFYLSDIKATSTSGKQVSLNDVSFIDLSNPGSLTINSNIEAGEYNNIRFVIGLTPTLNNTNPLNVPSSHPLSDSKDMHWDWIKYIFFKVEGLADISGSGSGIFNQTLSYHVGVDSNAIYKSFDIPLTFAVKETKQLKLNLNLHKIFESNSSSLNLTTDNFTDTDNRPDLAAQVRNHFNEALTLAP